ncbi:hypothetical protein [Neobacillus massiliamazoniensis]|uniref:Uncharacterized protein n=1 Tax=Neobacillus massiliamazoniensis TaxID=1499688 RepID=A0A0U1P3F6_9BACI|nr:hypothetical protein [Neobacillus massiliamazoniensis]CRK84884.1 hypothetical protein BN000_04939 [Neobacillus massiliamazoniensis]
MDGRKTIKTLIVNEGKEEETVIISTFDNSEIGICVSKRQAGDAEIWLNINEAKKVLTPLNSAIETLNEA